MAKIICHHEGRFNIYCTISDGFYFVESLDLEQLEYWHQEEYGRSVDLSPRLERAITKGSSSIYEQDLESTLICNRAGEQEAHLSFDECIERFFSEPQENPND